MKSLGLRTKFIIGIGALILLLGTTLLLFMRIEMHRFLERELHKRGLSVARHLAETAVTPILTENRIKLQFLVNELKKNEEDIRYIYIVNTHNEVLAHTFGSAFPKDLLKTDHPMVNGETSRIIQIRSEGEILDDVVIPIQQGRVGRVHVGISEGVISRNLWAMAWHILPFAAIIICCGMLLALLFAASISRPIKALAHGATMVGKGRLDWKIDITTSDEIGVLATTFNTMTGELQRRTAEQERVEQELHAQTVALEAEVARRQVAQEELAVKQQQLEALNQSLEERINATLAEIRQKDQLLIEQGRFAAMGEMISNIAHQWRQPLNIVGLIIQNLQQAYEAGDLTAEAMEREVDAAMDVICFMSQTIDDFRNFFGKDKAKVDFCVNNSVAKAIEFMAPAMKHNNIDLLLEEEPDVHTVGYANEFSQVMLNIICNARDVLLERKTVKPCIRVRVFRSEDGATVTVHDNGGGVDENILPRIYDPYFTTKDKSQGTGIGLYMSKIIIEHNMGGRIRAGNVEGGAEFRIEL